MFEGMSQDEIAEFIHNGAKEIVERADPSITAKACAAFQQACDGSKEANRFVAIAMLLSELHNDAKSPLTVPLIIEIFNKANKVHQPESVH